VSVCWSRPRALLIRLDRARCEAFRADSCDLLGTNFETRQPPLAPRLYTHQLTTVWPTVQDTVIRCLSVRSGVSRSSQRTAVIIPCRKSQGAFTRADAVLRGAARFGVVVTLFIASTKLLYVEPFTAGMGGGYTTSVYNQSTKPIQPLGSLNRVPA